MTRWIRIVSVLLGLAVLALAGVVLALQYWVGTGDFRGRIEREASAALGMPVRLRAVSVDLWPLPAVALDGLAIGSKPPLTLERVEARPLWAGLLRGRLEIATLVVRQAVVPEQGVAAISAALLRKSAAASAPAGSGGRQAWWRGGPASTSSVGSMREATRRPWTSRSRWTRTGCRRPLRSRCGADGWPARWPA